MGELQKVFEMIEEDLRAGGVSEPAILEGASTGNAEVTAVADKRTRNIWEK